MKKWIVVGCLSFFFGLSLLALPDGQTDYKNLCLKCHGAEGKGDGPVTKMVKNQSMGDLSDKEAMSPYSDEDLYKLIAEGGEALGKAKLMPAHKEKLGEAEIQAIITYITTFQE
jgi:mono/diheme cytochrome c family protein